MARQGTLLVASHEQWAAALDQLRTTLRSAAADLNVAPLEVVEALVNEVEQDASVSDDSPEAVLTHQLGPYLSSQAVTRRADISRQALHSRRRRWAVIGVPTDDHNDPILYPARQFADVAAATVLDGVRDVAKVLAGGIDDPLTIAVWLDSPHSDLGRSSAYAWLRRGKPVEKVLEAARRDARRWQQ